MTTISGLLMADKQDPEPFQEAFEALIEWSWRYPEKTKVWRNYNFLDKHFLPYFLSKFVKLFVKPKTGRAVPTSRGRVNIL